MLQVAWKLVTAVTSFRDSADPGDRITGCAGLWHACDRMAAELASCQACDRPTFRVITITSAAKLERRAPLCGHHYIFTTRYFFELRKIRSAPPQNL